MHAVVDGSCSLVQENGVNFALETGVRHPMMMPLVAQARTSGQQRRHQPIERHQTPHKIGIGNEAEEEEEKTSIPHAGQEHSQWPH